MPSFKSKMLELARKKDIELGAKSARRLSFGPHAERVGKALPDIPSELLNLRDLALRINKSFGPVEKMDEEFSSGVPADQLFEVIPHKAKQFVNWRRANRAVR
eukprot:5159296-Pyramimonas_sp.AAC.1